MSIQLDPAAISLAAQTNLAPSGEAAPVSKSRPAVPAAQVLTAAPVGAREANITFRRDTDGKVFYVVADAQSGKEIREVPATAVRAVGQNIEEYLRQQESKIAQHVNVKG